MRFKTLASGSKGNCSYLQYDTTNILIDIGLSYLQLQKKLDTIRVTIDDIDALFLTHTHKDHMKGLAVVVKHSHFKIYISKEMYPEIKDLVPKERLELYSPLFHIARLQIEVLKTSHDAPGSVGFIFNHCQDSLVYITDTGYINRKYLPKMKNKTLYYIESNHDEKMLMDGSYPYQIKQRIISDKGHLSNHMTADYLESLIGPQTKWIILAHISEHNNTEELALTTTLDKLACLSYQPKVIVAKQYEMGELIEV